MRAKNDIYTLTVQRLNRLGITDPTSQIRELAKEIESYRARIKWLEEDHNKLRVVNQLLEMDVADRDRLLEKKVEEIYPEFICDYQEMREELEGVYEELKALRKLNKH